MTPLERALADYDLNFKKYWSKVFAEYKKDYERDLLWLAGPSSYVFSLCGQKFAIDPQIRRKKDLDTVSDDLVSDFSDISFVMITHQHDDHMCRPLMRALKDTSIKWYIPKGVRTDLVEDSELKEENIVWLCDGDILRFGDLSIRAFNTPHAREGFVELGFELTTPNGKILLPADVRDYNYSGYPDFNDVDLCISHLWAGNDAINPECYLPLLDKFVEFSARFNAKRYFLCHLYEIGRKEQYMWHDAHASLAISRFKNILGDVPIEIPRLGERYELFVLS